MEETILYSLLHNAGFVQKVSPFLESDYFEDKTHQVVYEEIINYLNKYNKSPTTDEIRINLKQRRGISEKVFADANGLIQELEKRKKEPSLEWLVDESEKFVKDRALVLALSEAIEIMDDTERPNGAIPEILQKALAVCFDSNVGHDYSDFAERYKTTHATEARVAFDIPVLNKITKDGLPKKTLNVISAMTGAGKTLMMCHLAARFYASGKNVLYITLEMSQEAITERIDANLLGIDLDDFQGLSFREYSSRMETLLEGITGRLFVKEFPTSGASVQNFRALLNELKLKKNFVPDVVFVDYVNICASAKHKAGNTNSYTWVKSICEELRALAVEMKVPIVSATQLNRGGIDSSDVGLGEISESYGLASTCDLLLALIRTEELDRQNLVMVKQLKNRYTDMTKILRFVLGIDRPKMRLFEVTNSYEMVGDNIKANGSPEPNQSSSRKPRLEKGSKKPDITPTRTARMGVGSRRDFSNLQTQGDDDYEYD